MKEDPGQNEVGTGSLYYTGVESPENPGQACLYRVGDVAAPEAAEAAGAQALLGGLGPAVVADAQRKGADHQKGNEVAGEVGSVAGQPAAEAAGAAAAV